MPLPEKITTTSSNDSDSGPMICNICHDNLEDGNVEHTKCSHWFCKLCILKWYYDKVDEGTKPTCPVCRTDCSDLVERPDASKKEKKKRNVASAARTRARPTIRRLNILPPVPNASPSRPSAISSLPTYLPGNLANSIPGAVAASPLLISRQVGNVRIAIPVASPGLGNMIRAAMLFDQLVERVIQPSTPNPPETAHNLTDLFARVTETLNQERTAAGANQAVPQAKSKSI